LHVGDRPLRDLEGERQGVRITIGKENQRVNCLRAALDIEGKRLTIVVSRCAIRQEERLLPVLVSAPQIVVKAVIPGTLAVVFEAVEHVRGVEVVDPLQILFLAVVPGSV
jgi:hypothetical protein